MMNDFGVGGGGFDWNGNGKSDRVDDYMDYKLSGCDKSNTLYGSNYYSQRYQTVHTEKNTEIMGDEKSKLTTAEVIFISAVGLLRTIMGIVIIDALPILGIVFLGGVFWVFGTC